MTGISTREKAFLVVGMTLFWSYFRFQTVIQTLFHKADIIPGPGPDITAFTAFLLMLVVLAGCLAFAADSVDRLMEKRPIMLLALSACGTVGVLLNYSLSQTGFDTVGTILFWVSTACFVVGFLANYVSWSQYCSAHFSMEVFWLLALSFFLSLLIFPFIGMQAPAFKRILVPLIPLLCELMWFLATMANRSQTNNQVTCLAKPAKAAKDADASPAGAAVGTPVEASLPNSKLVYILLFATFLLCGSFIRGIVDLQSQYSTQLMFRLYASVIILAVITGYCFYSNRRFHDSVAKQAQGDLTREPLTPREQARQEADEEERLTLKCWALLAVIFFCGLFLTFIFPSWDVGGHLVVIARSGLDFLLWTLLCTIVHAQHLRPTRVFVLFSIFVEAVSWLISYTFIPAIYQAGNTDPERLVEVTLILIMFLLVCALTLMFAWVALRRQNVFDKTPAQAAAEKTRDTIPESLISQYKLTSREVEVISLFAQGYSLAKVSQELYISLGTAQSHIKNIYRKLDVHSKDELISLVDSWSRAE